MTGALLFLLLHSWKNRLWMRFRRLRQPKYLAGAAVGLIYAYFYFYRFLMSGPRGRSGGMLLTPENATLLESAGALILGTVLLLGWVLPHERAALVFSEAEVAFLFPAPVRRKTLIHFKLLKSQIGILFTTVLFTLIFRRGLAGNPAWVRAVGWWLIFSTLNLHMLGSSFARTLLLEQGISNWKRRTIVLSLVVAAVGTVAIWAWRTIPPPDVGNFKGASDVKYYAEQVLQSGPLPYLLYPFRLVVRPYLSLGVTAFLWALGPALGLLALHYVWVVRSNVAFEEASVEASRKMAETLAAMRANRGRMGGRPKKKKGAPFKLEPLGAPAVGFLWKNLIGAGHAFTLRFWLFWIWMAVIVGFGTSVGARSMNLAVFLGMLAMVFLAMSFLIGPQLVRQDFRTDLAMADVLKMYPLRGWQVALGELLAPAAILTGVQWLLIVLCAALSANVARREMALELRLALAAGLVVMAPALNLVTLLVPNAAVLLFPAWIQTGKDAAQGIEVMGQRLIFVLGQLVVLLVAFLPAAAAFAAVLVIGRLILGPYLPFTFAAVAAAGVLGAEAWLGLMWLGRLFERMDLSLESGG